MGPGVCHGTNIQADWSVVEGPVQRGTMANPNAPDPTKAFVSRVPNTIQRGNMVSDAERVVITGDRQ